MGDRRDWNEDLSSSGMVCSWGINRSTIISEWVRVRGKTSILPIELEGLGILRASRTP